MRKLVVAIALFVVTTASHAVTYNQAQEVFKILLKANHLSNIPLSYSPSSEVNAYSTGHSVVILKGMLRDLRNEDELALILGHELGHIKLHHHSSTVAHEYAADHEGGIYMKIAGYNVCHGGRAYVRWNDPLSDDHPASVDRYHRLGC